jgi:hypothetical protein
MIPHIDKSESRNQKAEMRPRCVISALCFLLSAFQKLESAPVKRALVVFFIFVACGKRGDPHAPVPLIPQATTDLVVAQRGPKLILSWSYPSLTTSGQKLTGIRRVILYRYVEQLPAAQPPRDQKTLMPGDIDPTLPTPIELFAKIPPPGPMQFAKLREKVDTIESAALAGATVGARLVYEDTPELRTTDGRPVRVTYAVETEAQTASSRSSNLVSIVPLDVAQPPAPVTVAAKPEGVVISWAAPEKAIAGGEKPRVIGYDIFRYPASDELEELPVPVNPTPVTQTTFTDAPPYGDYNYRVSAVSAAGPPRQASDPSEPARATFKDLLPPAAPANLNVLIETKSMQLVWDVVDAPDLAGYRVYRTEGMGEEHKIVGRLLFTPQLIRETRWRDVAPDPGIYYFYEVTAVDKSGNESPAAKSDWVFVPKTVPQ